MCTHVGPGELLGTEGSTGEYAGGVSYEKGFPVAPPLLGVDCVDIFLTRRLMICWWKEQRKRKARKFKERRQHVISDCTAAVLYKASRITFNCYLSLRAPNKYKKRKQIVKPVLGYTGEEGEGLLAAGPAFAWIRSQNNKKSEGEGNKKKNPN
jgi:hypothetical protein